jgi:hypothetical protein
LRASSAAALGFAAATAKPYLVSAALVAKGEVPPSKGSHGVGAFAGSYLENKSGAVLKWKLSFSGLTGPAMAAHIHMGKPGTSGPVVVPLCGPCKSGASGTTTISKKIIQALETGDAYVNVHTAKNPGGEIRGPIKVKG